MCCKRVLDILFPTNCFGKKKKCVSVDLPDDNTYVTLNIVWSGEQMQATWTLVAVQQRKKVVNPHREIYTDGDDDPEQINIRRDSPFARVYVTDNKVYFNCTNVTKLIVNGEQLI